MDVNVFTLIKATINTLIRLFPIGLYAGTAMSSLLFGDFRGTLLCIGFIFNEIISLGYKMMFRGLDNPQCAIFRTGENYLILPSPINQTIGFFVGFILADMYSTGVFSPIKFFSALSILLISFWSRMNVGCSSFLDTLFSTSAGLLFGVAYYSIVIPFYNRDYTKNLPSSSTTLSLADQNFFSPN